MDTSTETHFSPAKLVYAIPEGGRGRRIEADFSGGVLTSNGGALLLGLAYRATGLLRWLAECFADGRDPRYTRHGVESMVGQRVRVSSRRIHVALSTACPDRHAFALAWRSLSHC